VAETNGSAIAAAIRPAANSLIRARINVPSLNYQSANCPGRIPHPGDVAFVGDTQWPMGEHAIGVPERALPDFLKYRDVFAHTGTVLPNNWANCPDIMSNLSLAGEPSDWNDHNHPRTKALVS
jgi:hypothetical protein